MEADGVDRMTFGRVVATVSDAEDKKDEICDAFWVTVETFDNG